MNKQKTTPPDPTKSWREYQRFMEAKGIGEGIERLLDVYFGESDEARLRETEEKITNLAEYYIKITGQKYVSRRNWRR